MAAGFSQPQWRHVMAVVTASHPRPDLAGDSFYMAARADRVVQTPRFLERGEPLWLVAEGQGEGSTFLVDPWQPGGARDKTKFMGTG